MTSAHALRVVNRLAPLPTESQACYWVAWLAAYITLGAPEVSFEHSVQSPRTWRDVFDEVVPAEDDHLNKFVYSCYSESIEYDEPRYLDAADLYCRLASRD